MIKILYMLLNVLCFFVFIIHISFLGYKSLYPDVPEIIVYKKDLSDISFPLLFRICLFETEYKLIRFKRYGYQNATDFFKGKSGYNSSIFGWAGHMENGSTYGSVFGNFYPRKSLN